VVEVELEGYRFNYDGYSDKMFKFFKTSLDEFFNATENAFNFTAIKVCAGLKLFIYHF
jgi:hypothetical protein